MPRPPRQHPNGPAVKRLEELKAFGTSAQRGYYKRRVRRDVVAVLEDIRAVHLSSAERAELPEHVECYLRQLDELLEHVPHLLNASCQTRRQWAELEGQIPSEPGHQESLPL